jgi:hypothetical protein
MGIEIEKQIKDENERLRLALEYINLLKAPEHLGRPRSSDSKCIFCISYIVLNDGAFGESISTEGLKNLIEELK